MKTIKITFAALAVIITTTIQNVNAQHVSDKDLKQDTQPVSNALSAVNMLKPLTFTYDTDKYKDYKLPEGTQYGFIAEDIKQFLPGIINKEYKRLPAGKNNFRTVTVSDVDYEKLIPLLVGAIQEQQAQIDELKATVHQLRAK